MSRLRTGTGDDHPEAARKHLLDAHTLEVQVDKSQGISELFTQLAAAQIEVLSLRNKSNRLEQLFVHLLNDSKPG